MRGLGAIVLCFVALSAAAVPARADRVQVYSLQGADCTVTLADGKPDQSVQIPMLTRFTGEQVKYPVIVALGWSR